MLSSVPHGLMVGCRHSPSSLLSKGSGFALLHYRVPSIVGRHVSDLLTGILSLSLKLPVPGLYSFGARQLLIGEFVILWPGCLSCNPFDECLPCISGMHMLCVRCLFPFGRLLIFTIRSSNDSIGNVVVHSRCDAGGGSPPWARGQPPPQPLRLKTTRRVLGL